MQPHLIKLPHASHQSFLVSEYTYDRFPGLWHYHPEFEITWIREGSGTRFVGDHMEQFGPGDLIMIGANLPHTWKSDPSTPGTPKRSSALVLHFLKDCLGPTFWQLPEAAAFSNLLERSQLGLKISPPESQPIIQTMQQLQSLSGTDRLLTFLHLLSLVSQCRQFIPLCSRGFIHSLEQLTSGRITKAYEYILNHFTGPITLVEVAALVNMSPSAFSRYFRAHSRKTFSQFVIELRVGYACQLLLKNDQSVTQVCYQSGFNNLSNFNKQFRSITGIAPKQYQLSYIKQL